MTGMQEFAEENKNNMGHLWLRNEYKNHESRTPLTPKHAKFLVESGHEVTIEESFQRVFPIEDYRKAGCAIVPSGMWEYAPYDAYILGLKHLPDTHQTLRHKHIYFAHSFKSQLHSKWLLRCFRKGGGILYDLEYLINNEGKRVAAFGFYAGIAGAAIALMIWALKKQGKKSPYQIPHVYLKKSEMMRNMTELLNSLNTKPTVLIIGAKGRCGSGATELMNQLGIDSVNWDREHTLQNNMSDEILKFDILLNCVFVDKDTQRFLSVNDLTKKGNRLSVISDISCEPESKYNPLPFYKETNSFKNPTQSIADVDLIAIDNLPSYLPVDSSIHFSEQLITHLNDLLNGNISTVWNAASNTFHEYSMNYIIENRIINVYENSYTKKYYHYR
jgi:saccharopine dehydrogenase (NAD+, L-lysine forming)